MAIQTKTIECGAHKITYTHDDAKAWTDEDENLIEAYVTLVKNEVEMHEMVYNSIMELAPISKEIEATREFLMLLKDFSADAREEADNLMLSFMSPDEDDYDRNLLNEKVKRTEKASAKYHQKLTLLEPKITVVSDFVNKYNAMCEDFSHWEKLSLMEGVHCRNYKINSIDVCEFDAEKNRFQTYRSVYKDHSNDISRMQNGYVLDYNKLMLQTEIEYGIWNEFVKRLDLITKMVKVKVPPIISDEINLN